MNWKKSISKRSCGFGAIVKWSPLEGNKRRLPLNRTKVLIKTRKNSSTYFEPCSITLPALYDEGDFLLELVGCQDSGHYEVRSLNGVPFFHNRNFCFHAILCERDILDFDYNRIEILSSEEFSSSDNISLNSWPEHLSLFLEGETGTGKTTMAKKIHNLFHDQSLPFVSVNLSAFNEGLIESELFGHEKGAFTGAHREKRGAFELAGRGTLFIDEIDSLPLAQQVKVLNILDDKKFRAVGGEKEKKAKCRVIFASGRKLESLVENKSFRMDLFFRIQSGLKIRLNPLREEPNRIRAFIEKFEDEQGVTFSKECQSLYLKSIWPGNIRQLHSHLWRKFYANHSSRVIQLGEEDDDLAKFNGGLGEDRFSNVIALKSVKQEHCLKVYRKSHESIPLAAKKLEIAQTTLRRILAC